MKIEEEIQPDEGVKKKDSSEESLQLKKKKLEDKRRTILQDVASCKVDTIQQKTAWVLNHYSNARNSDITCQLQFWEIFEKEHYNPTKFTPRDLYKLTKLTSIARARAKIQNVHNLFLAKPEVRKRRGKLAESEKQKALEDTPSYPVYAVYADESGKTGEHLIVGSMWILNGIDTAHLVSSIEEWRKNKNFHREFHFKKITKSNLPLYLEVLEIVKERSSALSFKALSVERKGIKNNHDGLTHLYFNLLIHGVDHENSSGRAPLPRNIQLIISPDLQRAVFHS
ncbi:hypothetical protein [Candidatus Electrothrix sp.]|uniref:hypothetical protein n=1 Tax=Candidatus Electrothrix sp. TaxID=2170559 RepID=UPI004056B53E